MVLGTAYDLDGAKDDDPEWHGGDMRMSSAAIVGVQVGIEVGHCDGMRISQLSST